MTTATDSTTPLKLTTAQIWDALRPLLHDAWIRPVSVAIIEGCKVTIQYPDNNRASVDAAFTALCLPATPALDLTHFWFEGQEPNDQYKPTEFVVYGAFRSTEGNVSPYLPGLDVRLYCQVETRADAAAHWDGLILHRPSTNPWTGPDDGDPIVPPQPSRGGLVLIP